MSFGAKKKRSRSLQTSSSLQDIKQTSAHTMDCLWTVTVLSSTPITTVDSVTGMWKRSYRRKKIEGHELPDLAIDATFLLSHTPLSTITLSLVKSCE